jgi:linearmycin/streptolysin S transport system permease protein
MKAWTIAWNDTLIRLRDYNALILMLLAPLVISAIMGAALGGSAKHNGAPMSHIPLVIVNDDQGELGQTFVDALSSGELTALLKPTRTDDLAAAHKVVESGGARALIHIPRHFSSGLRSIGAGNHGVTFRPSEIQLYLDPSAEAASNLIRSIVTQVASRLTSAAIGRQVSAEQIRENHASSLLKEDLESSYLTENSQNIGLNQVTVKGDGNRNPFAFFAPSMAIFFLMITMFDAPRSILVEQDEGSLGRLIRTPTSTTQILLGKIGGSYLTGILQFTMLVVASRLIFNLKWTSSVPGLMLMVVGVVMAAASLGAVIAAYSKNLLQAGALGGGIAFLSAGLGGNFFDLERAPGWLQGVSRLTINRWALEGFTNLTVRGLGLKSILLDAGVLLGIAVVMFVLAFWKFQRRVAG